MKLSLFITCFLLLRACWLGAENAPATTAPAIGNALSGQHVTALITVRDFTAIGSFTLTLKYQSSSLSYLSTSIDPAFTGLTINASSPGTLVFSWNGSSGITLPDQNKLFSILFTFNSGTSALTWDTTGSACRYYKYSAGSYISLTDSPKRLFYTNGVVSAHLAPRTYAPVITNATAGTVYLPVTVTNFIGIGSLYLMFTYDPAVLTYAGSFTPNAGLMGDFQVGSQPGPSGRRFMILSWYGNPANLGDGSTLITLKFTYSNNAGSGNYSALTWYECGPCCEYTDNTATILYDTPTGNFYFDGLVTGQLSPVTWLPSAGTAVPGNMLPVPVLVNNFTSIRSLSLAFAYDPAVLTLPSGAYVPNPAFSGTLQVNNAPAGTDGKRTIIITWNGSAKTLANGSAIVTLNFQYLSGTTSLRWSAGGDSCKYTDFQTNPLWRTPASQYLVDGFVTSHLAPQTRIELTASMTGLPLTIPVTVKNFNDIGAFNLTLTYDPGAIQYQSASFIPGLEGIFTSTLICPGELALQWAGPAGSLPDESILAALSFTNPAGTTRLKWLKTGTSCQYRDGSTLLSLYDQPKTDYYIDDSVVPGKSCVVSFFLEGLYAGEGMMAKTQDEFGDHFPGNTADEITLELHNPSDYSVIDYRTTKVSLTTAGIAAAAVPATFTGQWYLTVKHRNSIETTSALPVVFSGSVVNYSFDSQDKSYGNNMGMMIDGMAVFFSGDENQDGIIDATDLSDMYNLSTVATTGYLPQDLTGDGLIDSSDLSMAYNNSFVAVSVVLP